MHGVAFDRPARTYPEPLPRDEVVLVAPPALQQQQSGGGAAIAQMLIPMVGMLGSVLVGILFYKNAIMLLASGAMILSSVGGGLFMRRAQRQNVEKQRRTTREKYSRYLALQSTRLEDITRRQQQVNSRLHPDLATLAATVAGRSYVWERRPGDDDFLLTRVGAGLEPLCSPVRIESRADPLADYDQDLLAKAQGVAAQFQHIEDGPLPIPLRGLGTLALIGRSEATHGLARAMLCQVAAFHAPDDVRIMAYYPPEATGEWSWLKWLPHTRCPRLARGDDQAGEPLCLLANTIEDFQTLLASQILPEIEQRRKLGEGPQSQHARQATALPHFVLILDGYSPRAPLARIPAVAELLRDGAALGVTIICLASDRSEEPALLQARLESSPAGWFIFSETTFGGRRIEGIHPDNASVEVAERISRALAPLVISEKGAQHDLSHDIRLLDLFSTAAPEAIGASEIGRPRSQEDLLRAPIGLDASGAPLLLDFKEAAEGGMGPHGLIIGATGSGKSELLRTIVTSLAINHNAETVSFVLADFKGGAAFADLAALPHTAGMISNLQSDLTLVDRMRAALFGEQERRQRMLREAGNLDNIKQYHIMRQSNPSLEPMPYLIIIVDEFAELLASRPDFGELFVAIGRVGRSLGMHLLLATQRLGEGRIQALEGHLRYRICLRTFSAQDSSAVIGVPDAFYLPSYPGIGYFKVDTHIYKQFKTATVSLPYTTPTPDVDQMLALRIFTPTGALIPYVSATQTNDPPSTTTSTADSLRTDMDVIITRLIERPAGRQPIKAHQVWLAPLRPDLTLGAVLHRLARGQIDGSGWGAAPPFDPLRIPIGLLDLPAEQAQQPMFLDFSGAGGHLALVGAPQTGKSTLLQTIMAAFMLTHTPRDAQLYAIDLGGGLLRAFESAPHVGAVCGKSDRDQIRRVVRQLHTLLAEREFFFRQHRIDGMATYRARRQAGEFADVPYGDVFLLIDNLAQFQSDFDQLDGELFDMVATGLTYGVHVIMTANRWAEIRTKLRDNIGARLELRLNDPAESEMGKAAALSLPANTPGRGVIKGGLQFQVALPQVDNESDVRQEARRHALDALVTRVRTSWAGEAAPPVLMLPEVVATPQAAPANGTNGANADTPGAPIGLEEFRLDTVYLDLIGAGPHAIIFGDGESGKTNLLRVLAHGLQQRYTPEQAQFAIIDYRRNLLDFLESPHLFAMAVTPPMVKECVERLRAELEKRQLSSEQLSIADLRNPRSWDGPHYFLLVDDYEMLVTPAGNPLAPLADLIQQGKDVGFHLILARKVAGASRGAFETVFQRVKESGSPGVILSGDPQEGALLGTQRAAILPPGRGYLVRRNQRPTLIQTFQADPAQHPQQA